jgi:hypothetical protein
MHKNIVTRGFTMNVEKIRDICRPIRIVVGVALIVAGVVTGVAWFYLGVVPLIAGLVNFCPLCIITKQCDLPQEAPKKEE